MTAPLLDIRDLRLGVALGRKGAPLRVCAALSVLGTALLVAARLLA